MDWFLRLIACLAIVIVSLIATPVIYLVLYLLFSISPWWMFTIVPIDLMIIWALISSWKKEQNEKDKQTATIDGL
ncbi:MAG: hypothetical protein WCS88_02615 [Patescibacteria group bacterium]|jgi:Mn2+/Fe2+ NRAMP family transporter